MFNKNKPAVHCYEISYFESDDVYFCYNESADAAISEFLSKFPNVYNDYIVLIDFGIQKDPDDRLKQ